MLNLILPSGPHGHASVFDQLGRFIMSGANEACEQKAIDIQGLYCWNIDGKPVIRKDFEDAQS